MTRVRSQVVLEHDSALPKDRAINVYHWNLTGTLATDLTDVTALLQAFYTGMESWLSAGLSGAVTIRYYDLDDAPPRVPLRIDPFTIAPGSGKLPEEVALCMSFQGVAMSGANQARRRGRIYFGPLASAANNDARPSSSFLADLASSGNVLLDDSIANGNTEWCVYSPTDDLLVPVADGWVDNAFDTQRRRGLEATTRTTFT